MSSQDFMKILEGTEYSFLRENEHLANKIMLLGLSGSYGYGTNREGSDVDFRGVAMPGGVFKIRGVHRPA